MIIMTASPAELKRGLDYFYFMYDRHGRLFKNGIDREYVASNIKETNLLDGYPETLREDFKKSKAVKQHAVEYHCVTNNIAFDSERIKNVHVEFARAFLNTLQVLGAKIPTEEEYKAFEDLGPPTRFEPVAPPPGQMIDLGWEPDKQIAIHDKIRADYKDRYVAYLFLKSEPISPKDDDGTGSWSSWGTELDEMMSERAVIGDSFDSFIQGKVGSHTWIEIMCITPGGITVGPIQVPSLRTVSFGLWPHRKLGSLDMQEKWILPRGIKYNYECFIKSTAVNSGGIGPEGDKYIPLTRGVTMGAKLRPADLYAINKKLFNVNWNSYGLTGHTCCTFAYSIVKDLLAFKYVYATPLLTPLSLAESMQIAMRVPTVGGANKQYDSLPLNRKFWCTTVGRQWLLEDSNRGDPWPIADIWKDPVEANKMYRCLFSETPPDPWEGVVY